MEEIYPSESNRKKNLKISIWLVFLTLLGAVFLISKAAAFSVAATIFCLIISALFCALVIFIAFKIINNGK